MEFSLVPDMLLLPLNYISSSNATVSSRMGFQSPHLLLSLKKKIVSHSWNPLMKLKRRKWSIRRIWVLAVISIFGRLNHRIYRNAMQAEMVSSFISANRIDWTIFGGFWFGLGAQQAHKMHKRKLDFSFIRFHFAHSLTLSAAQHSDSAIYPCSR